MKYELNLLESMVTDAGNSNPEAETARIKQVFLSMGFSPKKQIILQRYFRIHREGLKILQQKLQAATLTKRKKTLLTAAAELAGWMDKHLGTYLDMTDETEHADPDIDARRLITTFNLQELGVIIRLYLDAGVIRARNQKALTRFMSRYVVVRTRQVPGGFSEDHLYNAIHSPALPAMDSIQETLNRMLAMLNKLRREKRQKDKEKKQ